MDQEGHEPGPKLNPGLSELANVQAIGLQIGHFQYFKSRPRACARAKRHVARSVAAAMPRFKAYIRDGRRKLADLEVEVRARPRRRCVAAPVRATKAPRQAHAARALTRSFAHLARRQVSQAGMKLEEARTKKLLGCVRTRAAPAPPGAAPAHARAATRLARAYAGARQRMTRQRCCATRACGSEFPFQTIVSWSHPQRGVRRPAAPPAHAGLAGGSRAGLHARRTWCWWSTRRGCSARCRCTASRTRWSAWCKVRAPACGVRRARRALRRC